MNEDTNRALRRVEAATVELPERGGRGVLVPGGIVLTAMHSVGWDGTAGWALGDHHPVPVKAGDRLLRLGPVFADAVSDMAALGPLDDQVFPDDVEAFEAWSETTPAVSLSSWIPAPRTLSRPDPPSQDVHLLSLKGRWSSGKVTHWGFLPCYGRVRITASEPIESGMSGGPVVDNAGCLVGVVSWGTRDGVIPLARLALPAWLVRQL